MLLDSFLDEFDTFWTFWFGFQPVSFEPNKNVFLLPFGRQTKRQQPLLTPTGLIGLFHGYIRAMNFNDDGSHSVSDGLITHSHVTPRELVVQCVQVRIFPHFLSTLQ